MLIQEGADGFPSVSVLHASAGTILYPPGAVYGPRLQLNYQLVLLHAGAAEIDRDGEVLLLEPGRIALLRPGHQEMFRFATDSQTYHQWIDVRAVPGSPEAAADLERLPDCLPMRDPIIRLTEQMLAVEQQIGREAGAPLLRALGLSALLQYIAESRLQDEQHHIHPAVLSAQQAMRQRLEEPLTLEQLAMMVHVTPEHLVRLFRRHLGVTPIRCLWRLRLDHGISLLRASGLSIGEIAHRSGFQTSYHFARAIKEATGLTPTEVRRRSMLGE